MLILLSILLVIGLLLCSEVGMRFLAILTLFSIWTGAMFLLLTTAVLGVVIMLFALNWLVDILHAVLLG